MLPLIAAIQSSLTYCLKGTLTADDGSEVHVEGATLGQLVKEGLEDFGNSYYF